MFATNSATVAGSMVPIPASFWRMGTSFGQAFRITLRSTFPGQLLQRLLRRQARHCSLFRILVGEFVEAEIAVGGDLDRPCHRLWIACEQPRHLRRCLEITVRVAFAAEAGFVDRNVGHRAAHSFEEVSCVDWRNTLRDEA